MSASTNPFRRNRNHDTPEHTFHTIEATPAPLHIPPIDTDVARPSKGRAGKTVRIISPHSASEDAAEHDLPIGTPPRSPSVLWSPPPAPSSPPNPEERINQDPFTSSFQLQQNQSEDPQTYSNTLANRDERPIPSQASIFSADHVGQTVKVSGAISRTEESTRKDDSKGIRQHYDVDDFKKLLLTGEKPRIAEQSTADLTTAVSVSHPEVGDHDIDSETSSVLRAPLGSAISQFNQTGRNLRTQSDTDSEQGSHAVASLPTAEKLKPAAPRPRHGRLVTPDVPQTVSFEDPAVSHASTDNPTMTDPRRPATRDQASHPPSQRPLPSLPRLNSNPIPLLRSRTVEDVSNPASERRPVPHPPPTRRQGAMRPTSSIIDPNWSTPGQQTMAVPTNPPSQQTDDLKPAPPPPRRSGRARNDSLSALPTTNSLPTSSDQSISSAAGSISTPPSQSPSLMATGKPTHTSPHTGSPSMPPPPPPPRRRGSSQGSYTPSRLSGDYRQMVAQRPRGDSGASSISQLHMTPEEPGSERKDVLADLSALQREVDEFRGKMR